MEVTESPMALSSVNVRIEMHSHNLLDGVGNGEILEAEGCKERLFAKADK